MKSNEGNGQGPTWFKRYREVILFFFGCTLILFEAINSELNGGSFHYEFLICGMALCGIAIGGWGDKRS